MRRFFFTSIVFVLFCTSNTAQKIWNILPGDFADPTIIRVGEDFYMTNSSYDYVPGLLMWHSKDIKHWQPIGYALDEYIGDVWAPDLVYYDNTFLIYFPANGKNYVITANKPEGPWSKPIDLKINGIDPGHVLTPDGDRYLYFNNGWMIQLAADGLSTVGKKKKVYDGWPIPSEWNIECFCLESPKLNYLNGWYYLTSAQGGTAGPSTSHMVVSARSKSPSGPWINSAFNPVVKTWSPKEEWWSKGHGTIFDDEQGNWYLIYHAYKKDNLGMGRQVLVEPITWTDDDWFRLKRNPLSESRTVSFANYKVESDGFTGNKLKYQWQFSGIASMADVLINNAVHIQSQSDDVKSMHINVPNDYFSASIELQSDNVSMEYGFVLYYDKEHFIGIGMKRGQLFAVEQGVKAAGPVIENKGYKYFKLIRNHNDLQMGYSFDGNTWQYYPMGKEVSAYQHNMLKGFRNLKLGVYSKGIGTLSIDNFIFSDPNDQN